MPEPLKTTTSQDVQDVYNSAYLEKEKRDQNEQKILDAWNQSGDESQEIIARYYDLQKERGSSFYTFLAGAVNNYKRMGIDYNMDYAIPSEGKVVKNPIIVTANKTKKNSASEVDKKPSQIVFEIGSDGFTTVRCNELYGSTPMPIINILSIATQKGSEPDQLNARYIRSQYEDVLQGLRGGVASRADKREIEKHAIIGFSEVFGKHKITEQTRSQIETLLRVA